MADARRAVRELVAKLKPKQGSLLLVACSGGPDSMALAAACAFELPRAGLKVGAVIVDHGLQENSAEVAAQAASRCRELGLEPVTVSRVEVKVSGEGLEAAARESRYAALESARVETSSDYVLLGHNEDDQAETVLMGLARGSGLRSISGMPAIDPDRRLARPFLGLSRATLRKSCEDQGIEFWDDPHNQDESFLRVRVRKLAERLEETLGVGFQSALARTADLAYEAEDYLTLEASCFLDSNDSGSGLEVKPVADLHPALRRKVLQLHMQKISGGSISRSLVLEAEKLFTNWHGQKKLDLSGITVERVNDRLLVKAK
jgi:tRNA(Ile)-lysidine synthase